MNPPHLRKRSWHKDKEHKGSGRGHGHLGVIRKSRTPEKKLGKLKILNRQKYSDLHMVELHDPKDREKHGGYKYLITHRAISHTAYNTDSGLKKFLGRTGLKKVLREKSEKINTYRLEGTYEKISMAGTAKQLDDFGRKRKMTPTKIMDNAQYTRAYYKNGKIYYLNVNYPRREFDYFEVRKTHG